MWLCIVVAIFSYANIFICEVAYGDMFSALKDGLTYPDLVTYKPVAYIKKKCNI